ncbi:hypothetical protein MNAN1_000304 [Malassezia nana]|uniref:Uncharacterized protein n=1 Tax=Malassezia nana TaxID=180528 RepID=A0AAF0EGL8_9BASI|nr:hypothetical protein MNAN1_000304 [Malassezia nana]
MSPWHEVFQALSMKEPSSTMPGGLALDDASSRHSVKFDHNDKERTTSLSSSREEMMAEEAAPKAVPTPTSKTTRPCSEVLVIVQPNPKIQQHHPFNLQVQLVSPKQRSDRGDAEHNGQSDSGHSEASNGVASNSSGKTLGVSVARSSSQRSLKSHHSGNSESSVLSVNARRTIALYNLDYHQIRPKLVLDAGTDQMVAKFLRRTVEMAGFAILQPREIEVGLSSSPQAGTPDPDSEGEHVHEAGADDDTASHRSGKRFMNKLKRLGAQLRPRNASPHMRSTNDSMEMTRTMSHQGETNEVGPVNCRYVSSAHIPHAAPRTSNRENKVTTSYVWEIKQFLREPFVPDPASEYESSHITDIEPNSVEARAIHRATSRAILTRIFEHFSTLNRNTAMVQLNDPAKIPIWFEWVRDWNGGLDNPMNLYDPIVHGSLEPMSPTKTSMDTHATSMESSHATADVDHSFSEWRAQEALAAHRQASMRRRAASPPPCHALVGSENENLALRPWTCSIVLDGNTRIPIGRLVPAPQHPLVVCELLLPSPLPDLRYSALGADGGGFSREDLRDIVSVTALHLVVRESMIENANGMHPK